MKDQLFYYLVQSLFVLSITSCNGLNHAEPLVVPFTCNPEVDCASGMVGDKVPDPYSCSNYYLCIEVEGDDDPYPSNNPVSCDYGYHFDQEQAECVPGTDCQNICVNECQTTCEAIGDKIFFPCNCNKFYTCLGDGELIESLCPDDTPYFVGGNCTNNIYDCCDNCTPFCSDENTETADPFDCYSYYICTDEGIPSEHDHYTCQEGQYFNADIGACEEEPILNPCTAVCSCAVAV